MQPTYYSAESLSALTYDTVERALSGSRAPDIGVYARLLGPDPLDCLEVGCGTGRLSFALAGEGHRVHGLDLSAGMLDICRAKLAMLPADIRARVSVSLGDARRYALGRTVDAVILSFFCLNHLLVEEDWIAALVTARTHLKPGGMIIAHVLGDGFLDQPTDSAALARQRLSIPAEEGPGSLEISVAAREIDRAHGRFRQLNRFRALDEAGRVLRESEEWLEFLWLPATTIDAVAATAGLRGFRETLPMPTAGRTDFHVFRP